MATVILSENRNFLSENGGYTNAFLSANKPGQPQLLHGFWKNLIDGLGDIGSNIVGGVANITGAGFDAAGNIIQGAGTGVGSYISNPNNIAQIGGVVATGLTGMPIGLTNAQGQQQQNFQMQNQDPFANLLQNPVLLIGGAALIYLIVKK
jgi:hypothetical protein